jgi:hypothetical protein
MDCSGRCSRLSKILYSKRWNAPDGTKKRHKLGASIREPSGATIFLLVQELNSGPLFAAQIERL